MVQVASQTVSQSQYFLLLVLQLASWFIFSVFYSKAYKQAQVGVCVCAGGGGGD